MKFWTTGRIDEAITFEMFQPSMLEIRERINTILKVKNYGNEIESYDVIVNIFKNKSEERFKYSPKNKETDIDVNIDHDSFLTGDFNLRCILYINAVLHSIEGIKINKHLKKFDFEGFYEDLIELTKLY